MFCGARWPKYQYPPDHTCRYQRGDSSNQAVCHFTPSSYATGPRLQLHDCCWASVNIIIWWCREREGHLALNGIKTPKTVHPFTLPFIIRLGILDERRSSKGFPEWGYHGLVLQDFKIAMPYMSLQRSVQRRTMMPTRTCRGTPWSSSWITHLTHASYDHCKALADSMPSFTIIFAVIRRLSFCDAAISSEKDQLLFFSYD